MKKILLFNICMLVVTVMKVTAIESKSVYELCPKDPEAVYFTLKIMVLNLMVAWM